MKAMILAAGRGERMRPLTDATPKSLLAAGGKPLIVYHLEKLAKAGITDVVINHAWLGEQIVRALGTGSDFGLSISYSPEKEALETAGGIVNALPLLGEGKFMVINADIFTDFDFAGISSPAESLAHLVLVKNPGHNLPGDFVIDKAGKIIGGKNCKSCKKYTFSGIGVYKPELFSDISPGKRPLYPVLAKAIPQGKVSAQVHEGFWSDAGTAARLEGINKAVTNLR